MTKKQKHRKYVLNESKMIGKVLYGPKEFVAWDHGSWDHEELGKITKVNVVDNLEKIQVIYKSFKTGQTESVTLFNAYEDGFVFVREWRIPAMKFAHNPYRIADKADNNPKPGWVKRDLLRKGVGYHLWRMEDILRIRRWNAKREARNASL